MRLFPWLVTIAALTFAWPAWAFHAGSQFDKPPGAGGGGGIFYTGAPLERGWSCRACHTHAEEKIKVQLAVDPPALFGSFRYTPSQLYKFRATLVGEHLGFAASRANYNGFAVTFADQSGYQAGVLSGYSPNEFFNAGAATIVSDSKTVGATLWTFEWTAPPAGSGEVTINLNAVDGNGAGSDANGTLTDPFDDDVFFGRVRLKEDGAKTQREPPAPRRENEPSSLAALVLVMSGLRRRLTGV